ncbi:hypothetical protein EYR40_001298 [Pleurotus pulmonarius]|nr:hypothetical protein EYR38_004537 [Pleurotus pulmonarius]KAF4608945.1 hypothetical protein EYR40_001298 [Pleurotus pulmonarius]
MIMASRHSWFMHALVSVALWPCKAQHSFKLPMNRVQRGQANAFGNAFSSLAPVSQVKEFAYTVNITIGAETLEHIVDTGSSDLWTVSNKCTDTDCQSVRKYQYLSSSLVPSHDPFKLNYLSGSVSGDINFETITIGSYEVSHQVFALANKTENLSLSTTGNSGIMGLCFAPSASIPPTTGNTLMDNLFSSLPEDKRYFAIKLGRDSVNDSSSSLTFGEIDTDYARSIDDFAFTPVSKDGTTDYNFWKIPLRSLTVDAATLDLSPSLVPGAKSPIAVLDTGTTLVLGPTIDVDAFWGMAGPSGSARKNPISGFWEVHCNRSIAAGFVLGDKGAEREYFVHPRDLSWKDGGQANGWCLGGVQANDGVNSGDWLLGDTFLRNVYTIHHGATSTEPPKIGLLNLTDPSKADSEFRAERGIESSSHSPNALPVHNRLTQAATDSITSYIASSICGFMGGAVLTTLFRARALVMAKGRRV